MSHCEGCRTSDNPAFRCRRFGGKGACPEDDHEPQTIEGKLFVSIAHLIDNQVRVSMAGFVGMDVAGCLPILKAAGLNEDIAALLLPFWEQGRLLAYQDRKDERR